MVSEPRRGLSARFAINWGPGEIGYLISNQYSSRLEHRDPLPSPRRNRTGACTTGQQLSVWWPYKGQYGATLPLPLGRAECVCAHNPATSPSLRALQRAVMQDLLTSPRRITVGMHCRDLQSLAHKSKDHLSQRVYYREDGDILLWS